MPATNRASSQDVNKYVAEFLDALPKIPSNQSYVTRASFFSGSVSGNCGSRSIYRMKGTYSTKAEIEDYLKAMFRVLDTKPSYYITQPPKKPLPLGSLYNSVFSMMSPVVGYAFQMPLTLEEAYMIPLEAIIGPGVLMLSLTDTQDGNGDGHRGPFSVRNLSDYICRKGWTHDSTTCTAHKVIRDEHGEPVHEYDVYGYWHALDCKAITEAIAPVHKEVWDRLRYFYTILPDGYKHPYNADLRPKKPQPRPMPERPMPERPMEWNRAFAEPQQATRERELATMARWVMGNTIRGLDPVVMEEAPPNDQWPSFDDEPNIIRD